MLRALRGVDALAATAVGLADNADSLAARADTAMCGPAIGTSSSHFVPDLVPYRQSAIGTKSSLSGTACTSSTSSDFVPDEDEVAGE